MHRGGRLVPPAARELRASLFLLGAVFAFALVGLVLQENWPKLLRVGAAAAAYLGTVPLLARRWWQPHVATACPYRVFAVAGAVAGALGSLLRPAPALLVGAIGTVGGALLFGGFHYLGLRAARRTRAPLDAGHEPGATAPVRRAAR
jgi:hypothetical protein